jgi:hypothetical protein
MHSNLYERLQPFIGRESHGLVAARERITAEAIRQMTDVTGDCNPIYSDSQFAARSVHRCRVAPPSSLWSWWSRGFEPVSSSDWTDRNGVRRFRLDPNPARLAGARDGGSSTGPFFEVLKILEGAGFTSVAVSSMECDLRRYPRVGDLLRYRDATVATVAGPKKTTLGEGHFVTAQQTVIDEHDELVAVLGYTSFHFAVSAD